MTPSRRRNSPLGARFSLRSWLALYLQERRRNRAVPTPNAPVLTGSSWVWDQTEPGLVDITVTFAFDHGTFPPGTIQVWFQREGNNHAVLVGTAASTDTTFVHTEATDAPEFVFYTARYIGGGVTGPFSSPLTVFPSQVPEAPTNLMATDNVTDVFLSWDDQSTRETGFRVYRNGSLLVELGADAADYDDTAVVVQGHYDYYVVAFNGYGESPHSNEAEVVVGS